MLASLAPVLLGGALVASAVSTGAATATGSVAASQPVSGWLTVDAGPGTHTCGLHVGGSLWCWGKGADGQLGLSAGVPLSDLPRQVVVGSSWAALSTGTAHTCAVGSGGTLWCWGDDSAGQLGLGSPGPDRFQPVQVGSAATWAAVSVGSTHSCGLRGDRTLWCWGANEAGQLGLGDVTPRAVPTQLPGGPTWIAVSAGERHTCGLRTDPQLPRGEHSLWCWGRNADGQLGVGDVADRRSPVSVPASATSSWTAVSTGRAHTCAQRSNGTGWCWGANTDGQLGVGDTEPRLTPSPVLLPGFTLLSAGDQHSCGLHAGALWCWGSNSASQLGGGDGTDKVVPVQVGAETSWALVSAGGQHSCATRGDGSLWCWGAGSGGRLGLHPAYTRPVPTRVGLPWQHLSPGGHHTCGIRTDQSLWCWGGGGHGQLGVLTGGADRLSPTEVAPGTSWRTVAAGLFHTCGVRTDGSLWCWGRNARGELGLGDTVGRLVPTRVGTGTAWRNVHASYHTCAETGVSSTGNKLYCWGRNEWGAVGVGDTTDRLSPTEITLPGGAGVSAVATTGTAHTCALGVQGAVGPNTMLWCWGGNASGQLGTGDFTSRLVPVRVGLDRAWRSVVAGGNHTCGIGPANPLSSERPLLCWGDNFYGQLGLGNTTNRAVPAPVGTSTGWQLVTGGGLHTCGINGGEYCWGSNFEGELGDGTTSDKPIPWPVMEFLPFAQLAAGERFTCGTLDHPVFPGVLKCWGANGNGQLGLGDRVSRLEPTTVPLS